MLKRFGFSETYTHRLHKIEHQMSVEMGRTHCVGLPVNRRRESSVFSVWPNGAEWNANCTEDFHSCWLVPTPRPTYITATKLHIQHWLCSHCCYKNSQRH